MYKTIMLGILTACLSSTVFGQVIDVTSYGATPNSTTLDDDAVPIAQAIQAAIVSGAEVYIPPGRYDVLDIPEVIHSSAFQTGAPPVSATIHGAFPRAVFDVADAPNPVIIRGDTSQGGPPVIVLHGRPFGALPAPHIGTSHFPGGSPQDPDLVTFNPDQTAFTYLPIRLFRAMSVRLSPSCVLEGVEFRYSQHHFAQGIITSVNMSPDPGATPYIEIDFGSNHAVLSTQSSFDHLYAALTASNFFPGATAPLLQAGIMCYGKYPTGSPPISVPKRGTEKIYCPIPALGSPPPFAYVGPSAIHPSRQGVYRVSINLPARAYPDPESKFRYNVAVGDQAVLLIFIDDYALRFGDLGNLDISNVHVPMSIGSAARVFYCRDVDIDGFVVEPSDSNTLLSTNRNGIVAHNCPSNTHITNCFFDRCGDDGLDIGTTMYRIVQSSSAHSIVLEEHSDLGVHGDDKAYRQSVVGLGLTAGVSELAIYDGKELTPKNGGVPLQVVVPFTSPVAVPVPYPSQFTGNSTAGILVNFASGEPAVDVNIGDLAFFSRATHGSFVVSNNVMRHNRGRGILVAAWNGLIENNTIIGSTMGGIHVGASRRVTVRAGGVGPFSRNITLRSNTIIDAGWAWHWREDPLIRIGAIGIGTARPRSRELAIFEWTDSLGNPNWTDGVGYDVLPINGAYCAFPMGRSESLFLLDRNIIRGSGMPGVFVSGASDVIMTDNMVVAGNQLPPTLYPSTSFPDTLGIKAPLDAMVHIQHTSNLYGARNLLEIQDSSPPVMIDDQVTCAPMGTPTVTGNIGFTYTGSEFCGFQWYESPLLPYLDGQIAYSVSGLFPSTVPVGGITVQFSSNFGLIGDGYAQTAIACEEGASLELSGIDNSGLLYAEVGRLGPVSGTVLWVHLEYWDAASSAWHPLLIGGNPAIADISSLPDVAGIATPTAVSAPLPSSWSGTSGNKVRLRLSYGPNTGTQSTCGCAVLVDNYGVIY